MRKAKHYILLEDLSYLSEGTIGIEDKFSKPKAYTFFNKSRNKMRRFSEYFIKMHPDLFLKVLDQTTVKYKEHRSTKIQNRLRKKMRKGIRKLYKGI